MKQFLACYPLDPREKSQKRQRILLLVTCVILFCAACCLGLMSLFFGSLYFPSRRFLSYFSHPMLLFLNLLPMTLLAFFLYFLTNRAWLSFALCSVITFLASFSNYYKVVLRDDNLVFEDLYSIGAAAGILGEYTFSISRWFAVAIVVCVFGTLILLLTCRGRLPKWRWRGIGAAALVVCAIGSYSIWYSDAALYNSFENYTYFNQWRPTEKMASRGLFYPFIHSIEDVRQPAPPGYSKKAARALLAARERVDIPSDKQVNIISFMLESYSDFSVFDSISFTADPYEALREIWDESAKGTLIVDTMGGGTVNAERSFLTGTVYPHPTYRHATDSFVRGFLELGYTVEGTHPGHNWFYNRQNVDKNLGFPTYHFMEDYFSQFTDEEYAYDDIFFPAVTALYEQRDTNAPYFAFHVSYQGHSPYDAQTLTWGTEYVAREGLSEGAYYSVNNYLGSIADTSARIAAFTESLREREEPVVLLFFGDHKPTLGASNSYYTELGINMTHADNDGFFNYFSTPYWIWMNDAAREILAVDPSGAAPTISPCYLMAQLYETCGYEAGGYLGFLMEAMETLPVIQSTGKYLIDGTFTTEISKSQQIVLENLQIMQYYLREIKYN